MTLNLLAAAAIAAATFAASSAGAATISVFGFVQDGDAYTNVEPVTASGPVSIGVMGSSAGEYADVYTGTDLAGVTAFNSIGAGGSMLYDVAGAAGDSFTMIWGSVDNYNFLNFGSEEVGGADVLALLDGVAQGAANVIVRITAEAAFDGVTLRSGGYAFEHSFNPPQLAAVPLPAGGLLLAAALGGLSLGRRSKAA